MNLNKISEMQVSLDERHGIPVQFDTPQEKYQQLTKDLVGLFGEVGEFSNVVKKINIKLDRPEEYDLDIAGSEALLREELIDSLIYIIRIAAILDIDFENEILIKMQKNESKYSQLQRK